MDHGLNKTEGPPLTQYSSAKLFSSNSAQATQFSVVNDGAFNYKIHSLSDSFSKALEILNNVAQADKVLPNSQSGFDLISSESNVPMDLQTLTQRFYGLTSNLSDSALRELATISHLLGQEKASLNGVHSTTAATTSIIGTETITTAMPSDDHSTGNGNSLSRTGFGGLCTMDSLSGANEQTLNQLTHWSNALSTASPSAVNAFQHALAQMALLGLSSPQPNESADLMGANHETSDGSRTTLMMMSNGRSSMEAINLSRNGTTTEADSHSLKNGLSMDTDLNNLTSVKDSVHNKCENNSKVIIRQTADADEHFFKALRQLKVDVSADIQTMDRRSSLGLIMCPDPSSAATSTIGLLTNENRWDAHSSSTRREQPKISKSATELAVEEHFEKSLAAFNASKRNKEFLLDSHKINSSACTAPLAVSVGTPTQDAVCLSITTPGSASFDLSMVRSYTQRSNVPCLVRQYAQDHTSPQTGSICLPTVDSPSYAPRAVTVPGFDECQSSNFSSVSSTSLSGNNSLGMINSPGENGAPIRQLQPMATSSASISITSASNVSVNNSFKPKKNWLAQYDWRQHGRDSSTLSLTAPSGLVSDIMDSAGSSPASVGPELSETNQIHGGHRWFTNPNRSLTKSSRGDGIMEHEVSVQTVESIGLGTDDRPATDRKSRSSAEIQTDALLIHALSENQEASSDDSPRNSLSEAPAEGTRPRKILLLEKTRDDGALTRSPISSARFGECSTQTAYQSQVQPKRYVKTLRGDLALSSIFQEQGVLGEATGMGKSNANEQLLQDQTDCISTKHMEDQGLLTQYQLNHGNPSSCTSSAGHNNKCFSHWGLSNSCSPSPAHQDGSATSAVTPVSGTTSGFFTGSTYSLDSSLGTTHAIPFDTREVDSGIDLKSVSEERSFLPDHEALPDSDEISGSSHPADLPGCAWGMRKRASSEASPWSTLKRSRSVLASPLSGRVNCASCSSSSAELLLEGHNDDTMCAAKNSRLRRLDGGSICRCCEGQNRSLTPELNGSCAFLGRDRISSQARPISEPTDKSPQDGGNEYGICDNIDNDGDGDDLSLVVDGQGRRVLSAMPQSYPMHKSLTSCNRKSSSEPFCPTQKRSGNKSIGRSLSDAAVIPILHLAKEKDVFVLR